MHMKALSLVLVLSFYECVTSQNISDFLRGIASYKDCFKKKLPSLCLREKALRALNETIMDDRPIMIGFLEIQKNPDYFVNNSSASSLPAEVVQRSLRLSDVLMQKIEEFFKSRTVKLNLSSAFEGRGKGGGSGGGVGGGGGGGKKGMAMVAMAGMAAMMVNMVMGKMALMAGSALMIAKISLLLSIIMIVKKMQEKGGGEEKHIVYADSGHSGGGGGGGYGGGGGGWHRSLDDGHNIVYKGHWGPSSSTENGSGL